MVDGRNVRYVHAHDGRVLAVVVRQDFDEYDEFPHRSGATAGEQRTADVGSVPEPLLGRTEKAYLTKDEWPLQVVLIRAQPGVAAQPHFHPAADPPRAPARQQVLICRQGAVVVGVFGVDGEFAADVVLRTGDMAMLLEGHALRYLEPDTRLIEIKQGPYPGSDELDIRRLPTTW